MLIDIAAKRILDCENWISCSYPGFRVLLQGVFFTPGRKAGRETVDELAQEIAAGEICFQNYFGSYIIVVEHENGDLTLWCDNSYMRNLYCSKHFFGTDIRGVARAEGLHALDESALCEYLTFTRTFSRRTLIRGIKVCEHDKYYRIGERLEILDKGIGTLDDPPTITDPDVFFRDLCKSLRDEKTICALTGGYDSRLVTAAFCTYGNADCFISGDNPEADEICIAREAAEKAGKDLIILAPSFERLGDLNDAVRAQFDRGTYAAPMSTNGLRIAWFQDELKRMGYDVLVTGDAGGMHKDFWFKQDFPFYWSKRSNMKKLVDSRFVVTRKDQYLGEALQPVYRRVLGEAYNQFARMKRDRNARSYLAAAWADWESTSLKQPGADVIAMYAPLQEFELAKYSFSILPKGKRMNRFHRTYLSRWQPAMAKVRTIYGTNASDAPLDLAKDFFLEFRQILRSAIRYLQRKLLRRNLPIFRSVNKTDLDGAILDCTTAREATAWAMQRGYLREGVSAVPNGLAGKLIYCFLLERAIQSTGIGNGLGGD